MNLFMDSFHYLFNQRRFTSSFLLKALKSIYPKNLVMSLVKQYTNYGGLVITTTVLPKLSNKKANFEIFMIQKMVLKRNLVPTLLPKPASTGIISGMHCMWTQVRTTLSKKPWQNQNIPCLVE